MRILITGSRDWSDYDVIERAILDITQGNNEVMIVHGAARGADTIADEIAKKHAFFVESYPAKWKEHGRKAGPIRNQHMIDLGADVVLAFVMPGSRGTKHCISAAQRAGLPVIIYEGE